MQYQAGYILESVSAHLKSHAKRDKKEGELNGLLRSLSTFNVSSNLNLEMPTNIPSILAVGINILTRGLPTLASIYIEQCFSNAFALTRRIDDLGRGKISFPLTEDIETGNVYEQLYSILHVIDPRAKDRIRYLDVSDTDSTFEKNFLLNLIPAGHSYLGQIIEKQRTRSSFTRDGNRGRVDFSLEIPYDLLREDSSRYKQKVQLRHHKTFVIEIDGARYHTDLVDDLKDFEVAQFSTNVRHIRESSVHQDVNDLLQCLTMEDYVKTTAKNYIDETYLVNPLTAITLCPFAIARLQRTFLQYLIANYEELNQRETLKIAVVERDLPCARIGFEDLFNSIYSLNDLSQTQISLPKIEIAVFSSEEFIDHSLQQGIRANTISSLVSTQFDLILDISILRREGIFREDRELESNTIVIRNSHHVHYQTSAIVVSAAPIQYRPVVTQLQNEVFEPIEETSLLLKQFLQNIFRKLDFRPGQLPILNRAIQQKSVIGLLPTGGGKSLTYQLAAMLQPGTTIVIDPIRSLMIDQYNGLKDIGIDKCEFINSTLTTAERNFNQHQLLSKGRLHFLFVSPERFVIDDFRIALNNAAISGHAFSYAVIDEVHCVSEWGHDFRTPYLNLGDNAQEFCITYSGATIPLFGLTATASFDVLADIERELNIKENDGNAVVRFENSVRDEINYIIREVPNTYENLSNLTEKFIRESIGGKKQDAIFNLIREKENVLQLFNNSAAISSVVEHSFKNYVSVATRQEILKNADNDIDGMTHYISNLYNRLYISGNAFKSSVELNKRIYQYGLILFMPHRHGWLGIHNGNRSHGVYDKPDYVLIEHSDDGVNHFFENEKLGYFMGSGDEVNSDKVDKESFYHLDKFKDNEESVMVATKAFGMGIDKSNVRMTVHMNIPQSIESFVQEAGRAGRDGKLSASLILFNNDLLEIMGRPNELYHLDRDVLMYFHKNSFKGQIKERVMIFELRSKITFPNINNLLMLTTQLNELYGNDDVQFIIKPGGANHLNRIFINTVSGMGIGYVFFDSQNIGIYHDFGNDTFCYQIVEWLKNALPFQQYSGINILRGWLDQLVVNTRLETGLERMLTEMQVGERRQLVVPFTNRYYSKREKSKEFFKLNRAHFERVINTSPIQALVQNGTMLVGTIDNLLKDAVYDSVDYPDFIKSLKIENDTLSQKLLDLADPVSLELQRAYFIPRSQEDTAKAIYRLVSISIIDSYTIDYQNKLYNISFTKKSEAEYYNSLEELVCRYTSRNVAKRQIEALKEESETEILDGRATVISKCLEFLTTFIYSKIKEKRLQAIDDMVRLCQASIKIPDPLEQNKYVKDEIYYYFNAKYSRRQFIERTSAGELQASMPDDLDNELGISESIEKYISLVENEETGEFISNIKHLRGSSMRMLREVNHGPQHNILKSFTLFIMGNTIRELLTEAKVEFVKGIIDWKQNQEPSLDVKIFITRIKARVALHVNYDFEEVFSDCEEHYYAQYYANWTGNFNKQFLAPQL